MSAATDARGVDAAVAAARTRLAALRDAHAAGALEDAAHATARREVERTLGDALLAAGAPSAPSASPASPAATGPRPRAPVPRPSGLLSFGVVAFVVVLAVAGYARTGSPTLAFGAPRADASVAAAPMPGTPGPESAASGVGPAQIAAMVESLAARMKERPDDAEGWTMLARSYAVLGRFADAVPAYRRAAELTPGDAALLADWADAAAATHGKVDHAEPAAILEKALAIDPKQPKALALAGTAAYERGDYAGAIARWRSIVAELPPGSPVAAEIEASIAEAAGKRDATARAAGAAAAPASSPGPSPASASGAMQGARAGSTGATTATAAAGPAVTGTVTLAPALAASAAPGDTVFVFARDAAGGRMPLAVQRARVADLPLAFRLDDSMAMAPGARLSGAQRLVVGARVSRSGQALPQPGDLAGEAPAPVAPGASGVAIVIDGAVR